MGSALAGPDTVGRTEPRKRVAEVSSPVEVTV
jgi:hypothetical protein